MSSLVIHVSELSRFPGALYIGRSMPRQGLKASPLANPYKIGKHGDRSAVLGLYDRRMADLIAIGNPVIIDALIACRGTYKACWCRRSGQPVTPETACHGDGIEWVHAHYSDAELRAKIPTDHAAPVAPGREGEG